MTRVESQIQLFVPEDVYVVEQGRHFLDKLQTINEEGESWGYPFNVVGGEYLKSRWKRFLDVAVTAGTAPGWVPLVGLGALAAKLEKPHLPVIYKQLRHGQGNELFVMSKIRSQERDTSALGIIEPTKVGGILRRSSIDEIPQLLQVLKGEMSLVGRRPTLDIDFEQFDKWMRIHLPYELAKRQFNFTDEEWTNGGVSGQLREEVELFADNIRQWSLPLLDDYMKSNNGKPGLTGLHQVLGRRELAHHQRILLDRTYEENASLLVDVAILARTIPAIVSRKGAR